MVQQAWERGLLIDEINFGVDTDSVNLHSQTEKHGGMSKIFQQLKNMCWAKTSNQNGDCLGEKKKRITNHNA